MCIRDSHIDDQAEERHHQDRGGEDSAGLFQRGGVPLAAIQEGEWGAAAKKLKKGPAAQPDEKHGAQKAEDHSPGASHGRCRLVNGHGQAVVAQMGQNRGPKGSGDDHKIPKDQPAEKGGKDLEQGGMAEGKDHSRKKDGESVAPPPQGGKQHPSKDDLLRQGSHQGNPQENHQIQ